MALIPLSGTDIRLLKGIPFSNDYKHTRWFDTKGQQETYFQSKVPVHTITNANFQKIEGKNFIAVNKSVEELHNINYMIFKNSQYSNRWFYAFVTRLEYKQRNTTYVHFELDVFQTWKWDMDFKPSYVVREHCKLWNSDGTPVVNTIDEGLDYGKEYDIVAEYNYRPMDNVRWLVIVSKSRIDDGIYQGMIFPSRSGVVQPLSYYLIPYNINTGFAYDFIDENNDQHTITDPVLALMDIYTNESTVNEIVSIYHTENIGVPVIVNDIDELHGTIKLDTSSPDFTLIYPETISGDSITTRILHAHEILEFESTKEVIYSNKYSGFRNVSESKLLMYPYCVTTLDDFKGNRVDIKHEYINKNQLELISHGSLGTSNKVSFSISGYNHNGISSNASDRLSLENGCINNNPNDVPILTEYLSSFLQGNRNSLQNQKNQYAFNGVVDTASGITTGIMSAMFGNPVGAVQGAVNAIKGGGNAMYNIKGLQAKQQDIANKPPQISKMGSNTAFDYGNRYNGIWILKKQIKQEYIDKLTDFFNMYGYMVNKVKVPNFHTRQYWNYVQTESCVITGDFNNEDLNDLKAVFDRGITFWHTDDVGNYSLSNGVL